MSIWTAGNKSYILHERARQFYGAGTGWLSIKSFTGGRAMYRLGRRSIAADDTSYLVLNHGQPYSITIDGSQPVESVCVFFAPGFAEEVERGLTASDDALLSDPYRPTQSAITFYDHTYPHDATLSPALKHLRAALTKPDCDSDWATEHMHYVMQRLLQVQQNVYRQVELLPAARAATRAELYRRSQHAKDFATALSNTPITLDEMAAVAEMSPNHFLRTFKQIFGQTPYQFLIERRLEHAQHLLKTTDRPVSEICLDVGFNSLGTFSWLFRRRFGCPPSAYRRQNG